MADFLSEFHQFPCRGKDGFISLLLPELNVKRTVWKSLLDQPRFPRRILRNAHILSSSWR